MKRALRLLIVANVVVALGAVIGPLQPAKADILSLDLRYAGDHEDTRTVVGTAGTDCRADECTVVMKLYRDGELVDQGPGPTVAGPCGSYQSHTFALVVDQTSYWFSPTYTRTEERVLSQSFSCNGDTVQGDPAAGTCQTVYDRPCPGIVHTPGV
jgi:hypothetical protein